MTDERIERLREALESDLRVGIWNALRACGVTQDLCYPIIEAALKELLPKLSTFPTTPSEGYGAGEDIRATQIEMGHGKVDVGPIHWKGRTGLLLRPRYRAIPVGQPGELQDAGYWPVDGDVVIWIDDPSGANVLISEIATLSPRPSVDVEGLAERRFPVSEGFTDEQRFGFVEGYSEALRQPALPEKGEEVNDPALYSARVRDLALACITAARQRGESDETLARWIAEEIAAAKALAGQVLDALSPKPEGMGKALEDLRSLSERATQGEWASGERMCCEISIYSRQPERKFLASVHTFSLRGDDVAGDAERDANAALIVGAVNFIRVALAANPEQGG